MTPTDLERMAETFNAGLGPAIHDLVKRVGIDFKMAGIIVLRFGVHILASVPEEDRTIRATFDQAMRDLDAIRKRRAEEKRVQKR